jgi:hypothetical protein
MLAALAAGFLTVSAPTALAVTPTPNTPAKGGEACTPGSPPPVKIRFHHHRLVGLNVVNPCRDRVVFVSWFL